MGILKDAILAAIQQEHPDAHWVGNEKPHMIESTAQAKYNDVRRVERNYTKGVHKARKEAHNGNSNSTRETVIQTVSIPNKLNYLQFYFWINV